MQFPHLDSKCTPKKAVVGKVGKKHVMVKPLHPPLGKPPNSGKGDAQDYQQQKVTEDAVTKDANNCKSKLCFQIVNGKEKHIDDHQITLDDKNNFGCVFYLMQNDTKDCPQVSKERTNRDTGCHQLNDKCYRKQTRNQDYYEQQKQKESDYYQQQKMFAESQRKQAGTQRRQSLRPQQLRDAEHYRKQWIAIDEKNCQQKSTRTYLKKGKGKTSSSGRSTEDGRKHAHENSSGLDDAKKPLQRHESSSITSSEGTQHTKTLSKSGSSSSNSSQHKKDSGIAKSTLQVNKSKVSANAGSYSIDTSSTPIKDRTRHHLPILPKIKLMDRRGTILGNLVTPCSQNYNT